MNRQRGFTLVELMIALVILVGLLFTANFSYSLYSRYWSGRLGEFDQSMFYYQGLLQVKNTVDSAVPYVVKNDTEGYSFYFLGRDEGFTLVSAAPIFAPTVNDASVVRIFREQVGNTYQLVYEEAPLLDGLLIHLNQQLAFKYRTVLMRTDQPITFEYFGWAQREHKFVQQNFPAAQPSWSSQYDGAVTRLQPEKIAMTIGVDRLIFDLPVGHDKLINFYIDGPERVGLE